MLVPAAVFSAIVRVVLAPSVNTGALFEGPSSISVTLIVTVMMSVRVPSEAVIATV